MKIHALLSFLGLYIGAASYVVAGATLELTQKPREISGIDRESTIAFTALLPSSDHVVIDASVGGKQIHADIDYKLKTLSVRSFSKANGTSISLSADDIVAFQKLLAALPPAVNTGSRHGDALTSFVNLMASAPPGATDIRSSSGFTPICNEIGGPGVATYILKNNEVHNDNVTIGPVCYIPPALGRCGRGGGPDTFPFNIGLVQRFTQECLNHDQCCVATMISPPVCGPQCLDELVAAASGFFFAPDCGTTAGNWADNFGITWVLTGGDSSGQARAFSGTVNTNNFGCGIWNIAGTRTGKMIDFTATNPSGAGAPMPTCPASATFTGAYTDCNLANGSWTNSGGGNGVWSWNRTNTVGATIVNASSRGPANGTPYTQLH